MPNRPPAHIYYAVYGLYAGKPLYPHWVRKVNAMPYHQVFGIYNDRILRPAALSTLAAKSKANDIWHEKTKYKCTACGAKYTRDNPDLKYCEYCNSKLEEENDYDT